MIKSSLTATIASVLAVILAIYECAAVVLGGTTITDFIESLPEWGEIAIVGGLMAWLALHFGWFAKLLQLLGK